MGRLKRIKEDARIEHIEIDDNETIERVDWLNEGDFHWLIEQAEKIQSVKENKLMK